MRKTTRRAGAIFPLVLFTLTGCFSLGRKTPTLEQYVLGGAVVATADAVTSRSAAGLTIGLRRLDLAPYLATPAIVVRRGDHQIVTSEFHRWGEDLGAGIMRATARYLAEAPTVRAVDTAPWPTRSQYDYLVQLHVSRFEGVTAGESLTAAGEVHVRASFEILRSVDGVVIARGSSDYREGGWRMGNYAGLVTLLDAGLSHLARDLTDCLTRLGGATPPATGTTNATPPLTCARQTE